MEARERPRPPGIVSGRAAKATPAAQRLEGLLCGRLGQETFSLGKLQGPDARGHPGERHNNTDLFQAGEIGSSHPVWGEHYSPSRDPRTFWASTPPREAQLPLAEVSSITPALACAGTAVMDPGRSVLPGMPGLCLRGAPASARAGVAKAAGHGRPWCSWMDGCVCTCVHVCVNKLGVNGSPLM